MYLKSNLILVRSLILSLLTFFGTIASAYPLECREIFHAVVAHKNKIRPGQFLSPNELQPEDIAPILEKAPEGNIVGVGSERVIFDFLLKRTDTPYIIGVDLDSEIVQFHKINSLLLRLASKGDIVDYQTLRLREIPEFWLQLAQERFRDGTIDQGEFDFITAPTTFAWWSVNVVRGWGNRFREFHDPSPTYGGRKKAFVDVNYLYDQVLFNKIQKQALKGGYLTLQADLSTNEGHKRLTNFLSALPKKRGSKKNSRISIFDLSNAWQSSENAPYLGVERLGRLLFSINGQFAKGGLIVGTLYVEVDPEIRGWWHYSGFRTAPQNLENTDLHYWIDVAHFMDSTQYQSRKLVDWDSPRAAIYDLKSIAP